MAPLAAFGVVSVAFWVMLFIPPLRFISLHIIDCYFGMFDVRSPF